MSVYARVDGGKVEEIFDTDEDITTMFPDSFVWVDITNIKPEPEYGWEYSNEIFTEPTIDYVSMADQEKTVRLSTAENTISLWQTKLLLGRLSDADKNLLNKWLDYIDAVEIVDTSKAPEITWPDAP